MKGIAKGYEELQIVPKCKTEVHLVCFSCQEVFIRYPAPRIPEEQYAEIQEWLKEKEPKCENCREGFRVLLDENAPSGMLYYIDTKYLSFKPQDMGPGKIELKPRGVGASTMTWQAIKSTVIEMYFSDQIVKSEKLGFIEYLKTIVDTGKDWTREK